MRGMMKGPQGPRPQGMGQGMMPQSMPQQSAFGPGNRFAGMMPGSAEHIAAAQGMGQNGDPSQWRQQMQNWISQRPEAGMGRGSMMDWMAQRPSPFGSMMPMPQGINQAPPAQSQPMPPMAGGGRPNVGMLFRPQGNPWANRNPWNNG